MSEKVGFIGAGRMGSALMGGLLKAGMAPKNKVMVYDKDQGRLNAAKKLGIKTAKNNRDLVANSEVIFIAVKPKDIKQLLDEIKEVSDGKLFVSIAAGVRIKKLEEKLKGRVIRVMPNTPCILYEGASAFCLGKKATKKDSEKVKKILGSLGVVIQVREDLIDAVTGLSGSGPAYIYLVIKALAEAGVKEGLEEKVALKLAAQTAKGAAEMVLKTGKTPQQLIDDVCSPGGTTIEGIKVLEGKKVAEAFKQAVKAAAKRSRELSK
ncbi:MAG: pyrroline-5-carboxylate reductase [Candidatus Altiarchaeota archaeon]